jgi:hypothetical protein
MSNLKQNLRESTVFEKSKPTKNKVKKKMTQANKLFKNKQKKKNIKR